MMLFSATYDSHVMDFAENIIPNPGMYCRITKFCIDLLNLWSNSDLCIMYDDRDLAIP